MKQSTTRRDWLNICANAAAGTSVATLAVPLARYVAPQAPKPEPESARSTAICKDHELGPNESKIVTINGRTIIVLRVGDGPARAFDALCTHLGCTVRFHSPKIECACHGAQFDPETGAPTQGPPIKPLTSINLQVRHGRIIVRT